METGYLICTIFTVIPLSVFAAYLIMSFTRKINNSLEKLAAICCTALFLISIPRLFFAIKTEQKYIFLYWFLVVIWLINAFIHWHNYMEFTKGKTRGNKDDFDK